MVNSDSKYTLKILRRNNEDIRLFAEFSTKYVQEGDKKGLGSEIEKIKNRSHIDHFWIIFENQKLGIVKIIRNNYYNLGLPDDLGGDQIDTILNLIEQDIAGFHNYRLEGTIHSKYVPHALKRGYQITFSRKKLRLNFSDLKNSHQFDDLDIRKFQKKHVSNLTEVFIDAYTDSIDEKVGMFDRSIASSAIRAILNQEFGDFRPELSGILFSEENLIIGGILVTILEECPFVVIVGIKREYQLQSRGRKLMSWAIETARLNNFREMRLWVTIENKIASSLYESMGFKELLSISSVSKLL